MKNSLAFSGRYDLDNGIFALIMPFDAGAGIFAALAELAVCRVDNYEKQQICKYCSCCWKRKSLTKPESIGFEHK